MELVPEGLGDNWWLADREGTAVHTWEDVRRASGGVVELSVVPTGRFFQWGVDRIHERTPVRLADRSGVELEAVSRQPPIFVVHGFFSDEEASEMIAAAEELGLERSSVGLSDDDEHHAQRTSESVFDMASNASQTLARRAFDLVRMPFDDDKADGIQIVRYAEGQSYISHMDWFDPIEEAVEGVSLDTTIAGSTNRFATVLLYLASPTAGGYTVFPEAVIEPELKNTQTVSSGQDQTSQAEALQNRRRIFKTGGWEHALVDECRTRLAVKPTHLGAVLFYHQDAMSGKLLTAALHGGCPSFGGVKWAANMWIWSGRRLIPGGEAVSNSSEGIEAYLLNEAAERVEAWYSVDDGDTLDYYADLDPGQKMPVWTYASHVWVFKQGGQEMKRRTISEDGERPVVIGFPGSIDPSAVSDEL